MRSSNSQMWTAERLSFLDRRLTHSLDTWQLATSHRKSPDESLSVCDMAWDEVRAYTVLEA